MTRTNLKGEIIMQAVKTTILVASLAALAGCASWDKSPICANNQGWTAWSDVRCNADPGLKDMAVGRSDGAGEKDKLAADLAAATHRNAELERQLAERDRELACAANSPLR
jgi:hypothetical protein